MIGYEDDDQIRIMLFYGFEQDHAFIKHFYGADDHLAVLYIQFSEKIYITHISVDTWDLPFLQMRNDSRMFIDDKDIFVRLM